MQLIDNYFNAKKELHEYFGYEENWVEIPMESGVEYFWYFDAEEELLYYSEDKEKMLSIEEGEYYNAQLYTQRFLEKWVYETKEHTMISVDTQVDGNKFLMILSNKNKVDKPASNYIYEVEKKDSLNNELKHIKPIDYELDANPDEEYLEFVTRKRNSFFNDIQEDYNIDTKYLIKSGEHKDKIVSLFYIEVSPISNRKSLIFNMFNTENNRDIVVIYNDCEVEIITNSLKNKIVDLNTYIDKTIETLK